MSAAVQQGRIAPEFDIRDTWGPKETEPQTPLSDACRDRINTTRTGLRMALDRRFGPNSDIARALGLDREVEL